MSAISVDLLLVPTIRPAFVPPRHPRPLVCRRGSLPRGAALAGERSRSRGTRHARGRGAQPDGAVRRYQPDRSCRERRRARAHP